MIGGSVCDRLRLLPLSLSDGSQNAEQDTIGTFWLTAFFALSLGMSVAISVMAALVLTGLLSGPLLFGALGLLGCFSAWQCLRPGGWGRVLGCKSLWPHWLSLILLTAVLIPQSLHVPGLCDDTMYHLVQSRVFWESGHAGLYPYIRFPLFPANMEMLNVLSFAVFGPNTPHADTLAQLLASFPFTVVCAGLLGLSRWKCGSLVPGIASVLAMLYIQPVMVTLGYAYVELGTMLFCFGLTLGILMAFSHPEQRRSWLFAAGVLAAAACGTKYFGLAYAAFAGVMLSLTLRDRRGVLILGLTTVGLGCWWYVRSFVISGNPIHPFGGSVFGYFLWTAADVANQVHEQSTHGVARSVFAIWPALLKAEAAPLILAPLVLLFRKRFGPGRIFVFGSVLAYFLLWLYATQVARYLAPILPMGLFLGAFGIWFMLTGWLPATAQRFLRAKSFNAALAMALPGLLAFLLLSIPMYSNRPQNYTDNIGYGLIAKANEFRAATGKSRLMELWYGNLSYFYTGIMVGDHFGAYSYSPLGEMNPEAPPEVAMKLRLVPAQKAVDVMRERNCDLFLINTNFFPLRTGYEEFFAVVHQDPHGVLLKIRDDIP